MGSRERRDREKQDVREHILAAAREMFAREGFERVSMRQIAEAVEYSPTAIYLHFADKTALFRELVSQDFGRLARTMRKIAGVADPIERIREAGRSYIHFALKHPNHYRLMFMTAHDPMVHEKPKDPNPDRDSYAFLKAAVDDALAQNRFRSELKSAELIAQTLWAAVHGVASLQITKGNAPCDWTPIKQRTETMVDCILCGLTTTGGKS
jgi:AcrR family transcriptional regulator